MGRGKTTASYTVLPEILGCKEFVNADEIVRGLTTNRRARQWPQADRMLKYIPTKEVLASF